MIKNNMYIRVRVRAEQKRETILEVRPGVFKVEVKERALQNEANYRVRAVLADYLKVNIVDVRLVGGHHKPSKRFEIKKDA